MHLGRSIGAAVALLAAAAPACAQAPPATKVPAAGQAAVNLDSPDKAADKSGYTLVNPVPGALLRPFSPDRPTRSTGPLTVDAGHFQYETDLVNYTHSNAGGVSTRTWIALDPLLKVGLTRRVDLELQFNGYTSTSTGASNGGALATHADGAGDLLVRSKINLFGNDTGGTALSLIPYVKVPTAARNLGNNQVEGGVLAPLSIPLTPSLTLTVVPEVDVFKNANDGGKHVNYTGVVDLGYAVTKRLTLFGEVYAAAGTDAGTPPQYTADTAVAFLLTETLQLDAGANFGLNRAAPNLQLYAGISQRF